VPEQNIAPCGSDNCLAVAMEDLLVKQTDTLSDNLTKLINSQMSSVKELMLSCNDNLQKNLIRLETKHDKETSELFTRMGVAESEIKVIRDRQVGTPRCEREMSETEGRMDLIESCIFSKEQKEKLISGSLTKDERDNVVQIINEMKQTASFRQGVKIGIIILIIMGVLKFGLDIYYHIQQGTVLQKHVLSEKVGVIGGNSEE